MKNALLTQTALKLAISAHKDQVDKAGVAYILHPLTLASETENDDELICALLHDVIEDSDYTIQDLIDLGFPDHIIRALKLLTHAKETPYMDYILNLKDNPLAAKVKLLDLKHNSDLTRLKTVTEKDLQRVEKYKKAQQILRGEVNE